MDPKPFTRSPDRWIFGCRRFRAAQFAVERDYSNYEEVSGTDSDEGLVIANLGIAPQIVDEQDEQDEHDLQDEQNIQDNQEESYEEKYNKREDSSRQILILKQQNIVEKHKIEASR